VCTASVHESNTKINAQHDTAKFATSSIQRHLYNNSSQTLAITDLYKYSPDAVPPIHAVSYHVATDKPPLPPKMATSSGLFLATIYNQSQLAERKHVACYWTINTVATAVALSAHPSPLVIITKLVAVILGRRLFRGGVLLAQYCPCACNAFAVRFNSHPRLHTLTRFTPHLLHTEKMIEVL